jgi:hypothetical protein
MYATKNLQKISIIPFPSALLASSFPFTAVK